MNDEPKGYLAFRVGQGEMEYDLFPPMGYHMNVELGTVRVWDKEQTFLVQIADLIALRLPNSCLQGR